MELNYRKEGNRVIYYMPKEVDHHSSKTIAAELDRLIEAEGMRNIIFDMKRTQFMDSSGIGVIIGRTSKLKFYDCSSVGVCNTSGRVDMILRCAGIYGIVTKIKMERI